MLRLYTLLIIGAIGVATLILGVFGFDATFRSHTTFLIVTQQERVSAERVINNVIYVVDAYMKDRSDVATDNVDIAMKQIEHSDILSVTVSGHTVKYIQSVQKIVAQIVTERLQKYYGNDVVVHVIDQDRVPQQLPMTMLVPYVLMICVAIGLVASILAIFHLLDRMRERKQKESVHVSGQRIFEKFHTVVKPMSVPQKKMVEKKEVLQKDESTSQKNSIKDERQKSPKMQPQQEVQVKKEIVEQPRVQNVHDVTVPDGLQTIPGNLPVVDVSSLGFSKRYQKEDDAQSVIHAEPTEEELKARLNELLNGKL